jgi:predicted TIM-barrel fold metal-dependent hydrolase
MAAQLSRRRFVLAALAGSHGVSAAPLAPVIDSHVHLWSMDTARYPFNPPEANYPRPKDDGSVELYLDEMKRYHVDKTVVVSPRQYGWDNRYVADCVRRFPDLFIGHGLIDPHDPENAAVLEREVRENGLAGMRLSPIYSHDDPWLNSPANYALWRKAGELAAVFNVFLADTQLPQLEDMVKRFPSVRVVVDHLGRPEILPRKPWVQNDYLLRLARYPNVWVKFTELYTASKNKVYPYRDVHPFGHMVYDKFGSRRLLFGTGFVTRTRRIPLADELRLIREEIPYFTERDKERILGRNALDIWKWKQPS